ncbi:MAG: sigma-70 family RNA polymerase sigma factor [Hamadaea sp.]|uniref:ECF subfamily RNA polymerase sigma factor, BldN family n=1 Tax=Hamadaea sp. TaxID=2024425 RepID=UPI001834843B|nr:ECF subfamily RNA polymerase sigma factor, BldN family [Hamadaea sp.]NUR71813.1 sigma-70 family RNA polymerase sigma factor [Hamadaea sp.]NUT19241.1 sigma-70 family RNA polymerase sigma factor [Hamadaea sp.]
MTSSAYYGVSPEVFAARQALTEGLDALRTSLNELLLNPLLSVTSRGEGATVRARTRTKTGNDSGHHNPAAKTPATKPIGGRVNGRPVAPAQGGTVTVPDSETTLLPVLPEEDTQRVDPPGGGQPAYPSRPDPSDAAAEVWALVERAQAGEAEAFGLIYDRYVDTVFRFIYFRVGNRPLAEDLTSDTFLRALKRIGSFTWQGRDLGAWLVTIARNLVADHFKSGRYRLEVTTGDVLDADREDRGPEGSPEAAVVDHITNVALLTAVKQLNPEQQECIVLRFLQGFSVAETAQAMGKNEGAIKALQYRAVRALARLLPEGFQP